MRHRLKKAKLNLPYAHRNALLRNLATSLVINEKLETTLAKAKALQPVIERLISYTLKDEAREAIRKLNSYFYNKAASRKMLEVLKERYQARKSGFTRIRTTGYKKGDGSKLVQIELIQG